MMSIVVVVAWETIPVIVMTVYQTMIHVQIRNRLLIIMNRKYLP